MQVNDLVSWRPGATYGSLTAIKFFERMAQRIGGKIGLVVALHGDNAVVVFGDDQLVLRKEYLEVVNEPG
jgi:hypothetical protein